MDTLRNVENLNPFAVKSKPVTRSTSNVVRKPLRGVENRVRNIPVKASFKEKGKALAAKENVISKNTKLVKLYKPESTEVSKQVVELEESFPVIVSFTTTQIPKDVEDIDSEDAENPQLVSCYINEIYAYMRHLEAQFAIKKFHLQLQPMITGKMRAVLIDWLVQVHLRFKLLQETLYMTISIIDRYLQCEKVQREKLQCVGITAMFIASKYEEMYAPEVTDFVFITDNTYTKQEVLKMEKAILAKLDFNLSKPLPLHFLRRNSKAGMVDAPLHALAKYLMELTILEYDMAHLAPSLVAAAALYLAQKLYKEGQWTATLSYYSNYSEEQLMPVVKKMCKLVLDVEKSKLQAIPAKYASSKLFKISKIPQLKSPVVAALAH